MAHKQQLNFVRLVGFELAKDWREKSVLEVGSYDVNGSVRPFFSGSKYIGVDLIAGPGVDHVADGDELDFPDESFDLTISCECFEHNPNWVGTFRNMLRMTKKGGAVVFTCASTGRAEHGTTRTCPQASPGSQGIGWDYYRNLTSRDFKKALDMDGLFSKYLFQNN